MTTLHKLGDSGPIDIVRMKDSTLLRNYISTCGVVHIIGAGTNPEKPAHTAVAELSQRGWAVAPVHPRDCGGTIDGFPIRREIEDGIIPEVVVLFLAPERARNFVRSLIMRYSEDSFPLVWFQNGAEDEDSFSALEEMGANYVSNDCIVRFCERNDLSCLNSPLPQDWCLQVASPIGNGCSVWSVHSTDSADIPPPGQSLEWVGTLSELNTSNASIPKYIRSLKKESESLLSLAKRLEN